MKVNKILKQIVGSLVVAGTTVAVTNEVQKRKNMNSEMRYKKYFNITKQWLENRNDNKTIKTFFDKEGYTDIAIYGMGSLGNLFYQEIKDTDINIKYIVDKEGFLNVEIEAPIIDIEQITEQEDVDAIIVTPIYDYMQIKSALIEWGFKGEIISLEEIIFEI